MTKSEAAMLDSRVLNWHGIDEKDPPTDKPYYVAGLSYLNEWSIFRVDPTSPKARPIWASFWAPDVLGLPFRG